MAYPLIDVSTHLASQSINWTQVQAELSEFYAWVDMRNLANTQALDLPCHKGCDACCHASVFLTPLEFYYAWDYAQKNIEKTVQENIIGLALDIYKIESVPIRALSEPPPMGQDDHIVIAEALNFRCPFLSDQGNCLIYPARELYARLFGCSFNKLSGIYGCKQVGAHLADQNLTLLSARRVGQALNRLNLTHMRHVYPYYFNALFEAPAQ